MQAAIENWKYAVDLAKYIAQNSSGNGKVFVPPIDGYIVHMLKLVEVLDSGKITPETARSILREAYAVGAVADEEVKNREKAQKRPS